LNRIWNLGWFWADWQYRHSLISAVSISAIFDLTRFIILSHFSTAK
jgi:hypothetical protein